MNRDLASNIEVYRLDERTLEIKHKGSGCSNKLIGGYTKDLSINDSDIFRRGMDLHVEYLKDLAQQETLEAKEELNYLENLLKYRYKFDVKKYISKRNAFNIPKPTLLTCKPDNNNDICERPDKQSGKYEAEIKQIGTAIVLALLCGILGFHHLYLKREERGCLYFFIGLMSAIVAYSITLNSEIITTIVIAINLIEVFFLFLSKKHINKINEQIIEKAHQKYENDLEDWKNKNKKNELDQINFKNELKNWEKAKQEHIINHQQKIDALKIYYVKGEKEGIVDYAKAVLSNSPYPDSFSKNFDVAYNPENQILIVDYQLPTLDIIPKVKEVKFIASRKELKDTYLTETFKNKLFDSTIYQVCLRVISELFESDEADALSVITFNGWLKFIDPATGLEQNSCLISCQANKVEFNQFNLDLVDPKACFKALKGVGSSKLHSITPIKPLLQMDKNDSRIAQHYNVADLMDESTNLAMMDWEDFENLIRELFEKEFISNGGEVKVTQASRDGGVDAIAYDPDPIRGGKIVIQAKRYTNTVNLSAVRDLYGTVMNEGANKGILVTTADYGPDAYEFVKDKPITLLNGGNLLFLFTLHDKKSTIGSRFQGS